MSSLSIRKIRRDVKYSIVLIVILAIGFSSWILIPSISDHLESTLHDYSANVATYVTVSSKGQTGGLPPTTGLPPSVIEQMKALGHVENVYAFRTNFTRFIFHNVPIVIVSPNGTRTTIYQDVDAGMLSAPIGQGYFPMELVSLVEGKIPLGTFPGFVTNCDGNIDIRNNSPLTTNTTYAVRVGASQFDALATGRNTINYLYADVCVLWNPAFLQQELGPANFTSTFGGAPNFAIVKVDTISNVRSVVESLKSILTDFRGYVPVYDEAALVALQNLQGQTVPLYHIVSLLGLAFAVAIAFLASFLATGRRSWEPGLLVSQGWSRFKIFGFVFSYYSMISAIALLTAICLSELASRLTAYQYAVYGTRLLISTPVSIAYVVSSVPIALFISSIVALVESIRFGKISLERALKDY